MQVLGSDHRRFVAIEDSPTGVEAAVRAGIPVIGFLGAHPPHIVGTRSSWVALADPLKEKGACDVIGHWDEFPDALDRLAA
jgi:beta-phosphoglucomutase-like phosphatase (HAD superfamily)